MTIALNLATLLICAGGVGIQLWHYRRRTLHAAPWFLLAMLALAASALAALAGLPAWLTLGLVTVGAIGLGGQVCALVRVKS
jgi:hypothetical protein